MKKCPRCKSTWLQEWKEDPTGKIKCNNCNYFVEHKQKFNPFLVEDSRTDLERFVDLYRSFGIECKVNEEDEYMEIELVQEFDYDRFDKETRSDKFCGYPGFYSVIYFDLSGNFIKQEFGE